MTDIARIYIVRTTVSSGVARAERKVIDDRTEQVKFRFSSQERKLIQEIRGRHFRAIGGLNFYGLRVVREMERDTVVKQMNLADGELKKIASDLSAVVQFIPLYLEAGAKGEVYQQVLQSIQGRVYTEMFERLREVAKMDDVPKRSRMALLRLCDRMHDWNVLDDPDIRKTIDDMKLQIRNEVFKPVMEDLKKSIDDLRSRGAALEFEDE